MSRLLILFATGMLTACSNSSGGFAPAPIESRDNSSAREIRNQRAPIVSSQPAATPAPSESPVFSGQIDRSATTQPGRDLGRSDDAAPAATISRAGRIQRRSIDTPAQSPSLPADTPPALPVLRPRDSSGPAASLLASVDEALAAGELERAAALCERALRISPRDGYLWYRLASIHYRQQNYSEAIGFARRALSFSGSDRDLTDAGNTLIEQAELLQR